MVSVDFAYSSPNFNDRRGADIDMVVLHYTDMASCDAAIARLCDPASEVSCHYLIRKDGVIFGLVSEEFRAWHAGVASWQGASNINDRSIGIELDYPGHQAGLPPYPDQQITVLVDLLRDIIPRYQIPLDRILGHEDIAPERKIDPGENFPWSRLVQADVAVREATS